MKFMHASSLIAAVLSLGTVHASAQAAAGPPSTSPVQIQSTAQGQTPSAASPPCRSVPYQPVGNTKTFYLSGAIDMNEMNEVLVTLRNILNPDVKITLMPSQRAIVMRTASPEQVELAEKILNELDRPRKTYRITYTITERDGSKTIGVQHYNLVAVSGQRTLLKEGSRVPVVTANYNATSSTGPRADVTYLDVGLNFDATLDESSTGLRLRTKVEQSSIAEQPSAASSQDPVIRQTLTEGSSILTLGKPLTLGSIDIPGSTRHLDIEVAAEPIK